MDHASDSTLFIGSCRWLDAGPNAGNVASCQISAAGVQAAQRRGMLVDAMTALCTLVRLDPGAPQGSAAEESMLDTAFALVRIEAEPNPNPNPNAEANPKSQRDPNPNADSEPHTDPNLDPQGVTFAAQSVTFCGQLEHMLQKVYALPWSWLRYHTRVQSESTLGVHQ